MTDRSNSTRRDIIEENEDKGKDEFEGENVESVSTLVIDQEDRTAIVDQAKTGTPAEVCGVLGGTFGENRSRVESIHPAENDATDSRSRYRIDPEDLFEILETLDDRGADVVGFYHSHPTGPSKPSPVDVASATWPDRSYVIVSLDPTVEMTSWRWRATVDEGESTVEAAESREQETESSESDLESPSIVRSPTETEGWFEREQVRVE